MILDKKVYMKLKKAGYSEMQAFCESLYRQGFMDGVNADVDPEVRYIVVRDGTEYVCGNCGAKLEFDDIAYSADQKEE